jgi:uncharacterized membrane protein
MVKLPVYLIKLNARMSLRKNYWKGVLSAFLIYVSVYAYTFFQRGIDPITSRQIVDRIFFIIRNFSVEALMDVLKMNATYLLSLAPVILLNILVLKPLSLIGYNFFVDNSLENREKLHLFDFVKEVFTHYPVYVLTMALRTVILFGWTCLGIIPVFFKFYSYRMVPYILAKNPDMKPMEVLRESERVMKGFRLKCLLLDLSFIGWYFVSMLTGYLAYILFVGPYYYAIYAEIYDALYIDDQLYGLKYADEEIYHPSESYIRMRDLFQGVTGCLLYVGAEVLLNLGSGTGVRIGLIANYVWEFDKLNHYAYSIILICLAAPFFYKGIKAIIEIGRQYLGAAYEENGALARYFEYSAMIFSMSLLLCHMLNCLFRILLYITTGNSLSLREAAVIVNRLGMYFFVPMRAVCALPIAVISAVYIYSVLTGKIRISRWSVLCCPAVISLTAELLMPLAGGSRLRDLLECHISVGWLAFMMVFLLHTIRIHRLQQHGGKPTESQQAQMA